MAVPFADSPEFQLLIASDGAVDLARIALEIGRDADPEIEIESYLEKIQVLADRARARYRRARGFAISWGRSIGSCSSRRSSAGTTKTITTRETAISTRCWIAAWASPSASPCCTRRWPSDWVWRWRGSICRCISC